MSLRVAGYQMSVSKDVALNTGKICSAIDQAADDQADILLTPEGSLSGYTHRFDAAAVEDGLREVTAHAVARKLGLALGTCFVEADGNCYNQVRFYQPDGQYLGFHSKTLCCGSVDGQSIGEINHYSVSELSVFPWQPDTSIGGLICNDLWANPACTPMPDPHLTQQLAAMGARIIFHAVNGGRNGDSDFDLSHQFHGSNLRLRARCGNVWVVTVDNANPETLPCSSPSGVINPSGEFVCRAEPRGEQLFVHSIELNDPA